MSLAESTRLQFRMGTERVACSKTTLRSDVTQNGDVAIALVKAAITSDCTGSLARSLKLQVGGDGATFSDRTYPVALRMPRNQFPVWVSPRSLTAPPITIRVVLNTSTGPLACTYLAAFQFGPGAAHSSRVRGNHPYVATDVPFLLGQWLKDASVLRFPNQPFTGSSKNRSACFRTGGLSATFSPVRDLGAAGQPKVFVT
jgi:hypothetical protein